MNPSYRTAVAAFALITAVPGYAQQSTQIDPVVVSTTRSEQSNLTTPGSITIIDREEIEQSGANHVAELLRGRAGLQLFDTSGNNRRTTISMRGFGSTASANTLVLVDGRRLNNTDLSAPDLNSIALNNIERIEIVEGSAGVLFGDQAVGGVINIITRRTEKFAADISAEAGSFGRRGLSGTYSRQLDSGFGFRLSAEANQADNYRDHNEHDYHNVTLYGDYQLDGGKLFAEIQSSDEAMELPDALSKSEMDADRKQSPTGDSENDTQSDSLRLGLRQTLSESWSVEAEITTRSVDADGAFTGGSEFEQTREHRELTPRLIGSLPVGEWELLTTLGLDLTQTDYEIESGFGTTEAEQQSRSLYAQVVGAKEALTLTVGARRAEVDNDITDSSAFPNGNEFDSSVTAWELGASYALSEQARLFGRVDRNFRFAKLDEDTFTSPGVAALDPQVGNSYEAGYERQGMGYAMKLLVWQLDIEDEIDFDPSATGPFSPFFDGANVNLEDTRRRGATLSGSYRPDRHWEVSAEIALVEAEFHKGTFDGERIPMVAEETWRLALSHQLTQHWRLLGEAEHIGDRVQQGDYTNSLDELGGRTLYHLNVGYLRQQWHANLRINNLADEEYEDYATFDAFYPAPGRSYHASVGYRF